MYYEGLVHEPFAIFKKIMKKNPDMYVIERDTKIPMLLYLVAKYETETERTRRMNPLHIRNFKEVKTKHVIREDFAKIKDIVAKIKYLLQMEKNEMVKELVLYKSYQKLSRTLIQFCLEQGTDPNCSLLLYKKYPLEVLWEAEFERECRSIMIFPKKLKIEKMKLICGMLLEHGMDVNQWNEQGEHMVSVLLEKVSNDIVFELFSKYEHSFTEDMKKVWKAKKLQRLFGEEAV